MVQPPRDQTSAVNPTPGKIKESLSLSIKDGFFASVFSTLTGGVFITGFALALGANEFHIGIVAAIPLVGNIFQFLGSYWVSKIGQRKPVSLKGSFIGRTVWILIAALPFAYPGLSTSEILLAFLVIVAIGHVFGAISAVAWLSWIGDLVPESIRGSFFGRRNMVIGVAVMAFTLIGGRFLDFFNNAIVGFQILFVVAIMAGITSFLFLRRIPEPATAPIDRQEVYLKAISRPFRDSNFRMLLLFAMVWSFGINFASPFFIVFKLKELELSYVFVGFLISLTSLFDILGMRFWGKFSDKVGNRPVMLICSLFAAFLPFGWLLLSKNSWLIYVLLPLLHVIGGFFWAGMNLASANLLFRIAPEEEDTLYFSAYASVNGLFAATAALLGGAAAIWVGRLELNLVFVQLSGLKIVFLFSWILRCLALPLLRRVREPKGLPFVKAIQVLRNIRSINSTQGFSPLLHFFIPSLRKPGTDVQDK